MCQGVHCPGARSEVSKSRGKYFSLRLEKITEKNNYVRFSFLLPQKGQEEGVEREKG